MTGTRAPDFMSRTDRLEEVAFLLATGYVRLLRARRNPLDLSARAEALRCASTGGNPTPGKEAS